MISDTAIRACGLGVLQRQLDEVLPQLFVGLRLHKGDGRRHVRQPPNDELQRAPRRAHAPQHMHLHSDAKALHLSVTK